MQIEVKNHLTNEIMFTETVEDNDPQPLRTVLERLVGRNFSIQDADLKGANLHFANLQGADLLGTDLRNANLQFADLQGADLQFADLQNADLQTASLQDAVLRDANLKGANLQYANFQDANLQSVKLEVSEETRQDFYQILDQNPSEVLPLLTLLRQGKINGKTYEGECTCLVSSIARLKGVSYRHLYPNSFRLAEQWFWAIHERHTPQNNEFARITEQWILQWLTLHNV